MRALRGLAALLCPAVAAAQSCPGVEQDTTYLGDDIKKESASSADECCDMCNKEPGCKYWNFHKKKRCNMKSDKGNVQTNKGDVSGSSGAAPAPTPPTPPTPPVPTPAPGPTPPPSPVPSTPPPPGNPKPNIVFILSDDLGYGEYSISPHVNAQFRLPTPNIERIAQNGMKFLRGYSGQVCAPSRCTLMTGRDTGHCTVRGNDGAYTPLLETDTTVAAVLRKAGYRTGIVGKWGLGNFGTSGYPLQQGYDYFVGQDSQVGCHDWYPLKVQNNTDAKCVLNTKKDLDYEKCLSNAATCTWVNDLTKRLGVEFIRGSAGAVPFFLYLATTTPHVGELHGSGKTPAGYDKHFPVPYPYNQRFKDESGGKWNDNQRQFAAAVWAQDLIVGAVLDELAALSIEDKTVLFFTGDNGPDHITPLFDDPGPFRGKKRSLHEGGIRQTIVVQWPGTIAAGTTSDALFAFWDLLPTLADIAGVPPAELPPHEGVSVAPIFAASTRGAAAAAEADRAAAASGRYLYYEFCRNGDVDGLLPQAYKKGWVQAVRWDDNATAFRTEWKGIVSNKNRAAILLYNITNDQSESKPLLPASAGNAIDPVVERARDMVLAIMDASHVENPYWPSSKSADKCCDNCFNPGGCPSPCKCMNPPCKPSAPAPAPIPLSALSGEWTGSNGNACEGECKFSLAVAAGGGVLVSSPANAASCWTKGAGALSADGAAITGVVATGPNCVRHASGTVRRKTATYAVDVDYTYAVESLEIEWAVTDEKGRKQLWPSWSTPLGEPTIVL